MGLTATVELNRSWTMFGTANYSRLLGDAADSPVIDTRDQFVAGLGVTPLAGEHHAQEVARLGVGRVAQPRVAAKRVDRAKDRDEHLLGEVFSLGAVAEHAVDERAGVALAPRGPLQEGRMAGVDLLQELAREHLAHADPVQQVERLHAFRHRHPRVPDVAAGLAQAGQRVLLIDLDPQGNATMGSGIDKRALALSVYDVLLESASMSRGQPASLVAKG